MAKYDPLFEHLCRAPDEPVTLRFDEIAALVGGLPASASRHDAWWSNDGVQVHSQPWRNAGREVVAVDRTAGEVTFSEPRWLRGA